MGDKFTYAGDLDPLPVKVKVSFVVCLGTHACQGAVGPSFYTQSSHHLSVFQNGPTCCRQDFTAAPQLPDGLTKLQTVLNLLQATYFWSSRGIVNTKLSDNDDTPTLLSSGIACFPLHQSAHHVGWRFYSSFWQQPRTEHKSLVPCCYPRPDCWSRRRQSSVLGHP